MKKVAIFGNTGGGKSTLARRLAELTRLPLYPLDLIQYRPGGGEVPRQDYLRAHADLLDKDEWIIKALAVLPLPGSGSSRPIPSFMSICLSPHITGG
jgi:adenylate kinase family enzyme